MSHSNSGKRKPRGGVMPWLLRFQAAVFQLVSAHATYSGALEFVVDVKLLAGVITFGVQLGLLVTVHLLGAVLTGEQKERTSAIPPALAMLVVLPLSVFFSAFGFYQHYGLAQGNRAAEMRVTGEEVGRAAAELDRYRTDALAYVSGELGRREAERKKQQARASNARLKDAARAAARLRAAQLEREVAGLRQAAGELENVDTIGSATRDTADAMRRDLLAAQRAISNVVAQHAPDYAETHPVSQPVPVPLPAAEVQEGFFRDLRTKTTPALTTLALASVVDLLSSLFILCGVKVSSTEERILGLKRKAGRIYRAVFPLTDTADTYTPVRFCARGAGVSADFVVNFAKADYDLTGFDVIASLPAIEGQLNRGRQTRVEIEGVRNAAGEELSPAAPLFRQLEADRTVYLRLAKRDESDWPEEVADEAA